MPDSGIVSRALMIFTHSSDICIIEPINNIITRVRHEIGHVHIDNGIFVQVLLERRMAGYLQVSKQVARVARLVVVGTQHLCRHRLAEAAATRHTAVTLACLQGLVDNGYQLRLVNVFPVSCTLEREVPFVDIRTHCLYSVYHLQIYEFLCYYRLYLLSFCLF